MHAVPGCGGADCTECSRDLPQICETGHHSGIGQNGFYAPYGTLDIRGAAKVPEGKLTLLAPRLNTYSRKRKNPNFG